MQVRELMTGGPIAVAPQTPVFEARQLMMQARIRHLLVLDHGRLVGMVTDRDIRLNWPSQATSLSVWELNYLLAKLTVDGIMSQAVISVGPDRPIADAARLMLDHKIGGLPVIEDGVVIGILTETDIVRAFAQAAAASPAYR